MTTPHQDIPSRVDAILDLLVPPSNYHDDHKCHTVGRCFKHQQRDKILTLIREVGEAVIAGDDYPGFFTGSAGQTRNHIRNTLRDEQRTRLDEMLGRQ